jgi:hypothetical protein
MEYVKNNGQNRQIIITDFYGQPYIYYLFYQKYPPQNYQLQATLQENGVDTGLVTKIDNISFTSPDISDMRSKSNPILAIISYDEIIRQGENPADFLQISPLFYVFQN